MTEEKKRVRDDSNEGPPPRPKERQSAEEFRGSVGRLRRGRGLGRGQIRDHVKMVSGPYAQLVVESVLGYLRTRRWAFNGHQTQWSVHKLHH